MGDRYISAHEVDVDLFLDQINVFFMILNKHLNVIVSFMFMQMASNEVVALFHLILYFFLFS